MEAIHCQCFKRGQKRKEWTGRWKGFKFPNGEKTVLQALGFWEREKEMKIGRANDVVVKVLPMTRDFFSFFFVWWRRGQG